MKDTGLDSPRLSSKQEELLEHIKFIKEKIQSELKRLKRPPTRPLNKLNPEELARYYEGPEFSRLCKLRKEVDTLTVKAIRSLFRRIPGKKGYPVMCMNFNEDERGRLQSFNSFVPGDGIEYHPGIPRWALNHMSLWVHEKRSIRSYDNYYILAACKMGFETGLQEPLDYDLLERVLRARGFDMLSEKDLKKISKKDRKNKTKVGRPKKRVRKVSNSWDRIALGLARAAKEGSIPTTGEGLKIMLQKMFPEIDFDKV